ncbi:hypothetical protein N7495_005201 [Penicillium taxi]|uniref:uncharacterized protein n=1 Tax=Penicillium taxi TaxID=168475 RepID=UPI002545016B|nr:uncharacterized protein N7495_005201 [Penicillium taxi]KAJ5893510.1 hypothetical protein N7495_005201 [Penicillium taxi]
MSHWREEYLAALAVRDRKEKASVELYDAYTRLADRTATLAANPIEEHSREPRRSSSSTSTIKNQPHYETGLSPAELLDTARTELSEAQRSRSDLQGCLDRVTAEVEKLRKQNIQHTRKINSSESQRAQLQLRLKDRDEELRGKAKLLEDFQDEMATLNLQLNMAEEKSNKFQRENQDLVDRWMARMGLEADAMNDASKF